MSWQFFARHGGLCVHPGESIDEARERNGKHLAMAERWAREHDVRFEWRPDWDGDHSYRKDSNWTESEPNPWAGEPSPQTCEECIGWDSDGHVVAALGCIDDATPEYRRVVEAELASEVMSEHAVRVRS